MPAPRISKEILLDKAAALFSERGYEATTMRDLTTALQVTRPTLYVYGGSKREILQAIYQRLRAYFDEWFPEYVDLRAAALDRLTGFFRMQIAATEEIGPTLRLALTSLRTMGGSYDPMLQTWWTGLDRAIDDIVEEIQIGSPESGVITRQTIKACLGDIPFWYRHGGALSPAAVVDGTIRILMGTSRQRRPRLQTVTVATAPAPPVVTSVSRDGLRGSAQLRSTHDAIELAAICAEVCKQVMQAARPGSPEWRTLATSTSFTAIPVGAAGLVCNVSASELADGSLVWDCTVSEEQAGLVACVRIVGRLGG